MKHFKEERTLVIIKPDGVQRSLIGEVLKRYERLGLKLIGIKMLVPNEKMIEEHYTLDPNWRKITGEKTIKGYIDKNLKPPSEDPFQITEIILNDLKKYMTSGPVIAMWEQLGAASFLIRIRCLMWIIVLLETLFMHLALKKKLN